MGGGRHTDKSFLWCDRLLVHMSSTSPSSHCFCLYNSGVSGFSNMPITLAKWLASIHRDTINDHYYLGFGFGQGCLPACCSPLEAKPPHKG